jgi:hypothetical protein
VCLHGACRTATGGSRGAHDIHSAEASAGPLRHPKAHAATAPYHHEQQQLAPAHLTTPTPQAVAAPPQDVLPAGASPGEHADAGTGTMIAAAPRRGGYSQGADAAAEALMRQWQALPGPLEMGGELPISSRY